MELYRLILGKWALNIGDLLKILKEAPCPRSLIKITSERLLNPKKALYSPFLENFSETFIRYLVLILVVVQESPIKLNLLGTEAV